MRAECESCGEGAAEGGTELVPRAVLRAVRALPSASCDSASCDSCLEPLAPRRLSDSGPRSLKRVRARWPGVDGEQNLRARSQGSSRPAPHSSRSPPPASLSGRYTHRTREAGAQRGEGPEDDGTEQTTAAPAPQLASKIKPPTNVRGRGGGGEEEWVKKEDGVWVLRRAEREAWCAQAEAPCQVASPLPLEEAEAEAQGWRSESRARGGMGGGVGAGGRLEELLDKHRQQQHLVQPLRSRSRRAGGAAGTAGSTRCGGEQAVGYDGAQEGSRALVSALSSRGVSRGGRSEVGHGVGGGDEAGAARMVRRLRSATARASAVGVQGAGLLSFAFAFASACFACHLFLFRCALPCVSVRRRQGWSPQGQGCIRQHQPSY